MAINDNVLAIFLSVIYDLPPLEHMPLKAFYVACGTLNGSIKME